MADLLFLDANWDLVTRYLFSFRTHFLATHTNPPNHTIRQLKDVDVVQPTVDQYLNIKNVVYISGAGHGVYDTFKGFHDAIIWTEGTPLPNFDGIIVHLLSCQTARELGPAILAAGASAFWGYQENFRFLRKKTPPADLYTDSSAEWAIYMDCLIDIGVLLGLASDDIYQEVRNFVNHETSNLGLFHIKRVILNHNFRHLVCPSVNWGDRNATI